ncbi:MAG: ComEC/Rec2 family competence protein, partial [Pseudomonadota bacterium]
RWPRLTVGVRQVLGQTQWHRAAANAFAAQVSRLFVWTAVVFGMGAGLYYRLPFEPQFWSLGVGFCLAAIVAVQSLRTPALCLVAVLALGYGWAGVMAYAYLSPVLEKRIYGDVSGRIVAVDVSASGKPRLTLDQVTTPELPPFAQPERVRIALHGQGGVPAIGSQIRIVAHLSPPPGPAEPGGFDFQRHAWFLALGGVGYSRKAPEIQADPTGMWLARLRAAIGTWIRDNTSDDVSGIATAITTGDRRFLKDADVEALRRSNLAHLLAISGLHMGLLVGLVFGTLRLGFLAVRGIDAKRWAAAGALAAATGYLFLSGASIATERAVVMAAVMLIAVLSRNRALSLRAISLAALVVLILRPQAIFSPGFHMSFAATLALIVVFQYGTQQLWFKGAGWRRALLGTVLSSLVAGLATAPFAAAHFNQVPHYGLAANIVSVPMMGLVVMPGLLAGFALAPLGLEHVGFAIAQWGLGVILTVAHTVAAWPGAFSQIKAPPAVSLPMFTLGALILCLWIGKGRIMGVAICAAAAVIWAQSDRPDILIADTANLVGVLGPEGRHLSREKGSGFAARIWLENDGDFSTQSQAATRVRGTAPAITVSRKAEDVTDSCDGAIHVVADYMDWPPCDVFDLRRLRRTGSVAGYIGPSGVQWVSAKDISGRRLWNDRWVRRDALAMWPFRTLRPGLPN